MKTEKLSFKDIEKWCKDNGYELIRNQKHPNPFINILNRIEIFTGISPEQINLPIKTKDIVEARQLAQRIAKKQTNYSLAIIGKWIGNKDHATVLHSVKTVSNFIETNREYRDKYSELIEFYGLE